jgi:hypothetical protein
MCWDCNVKHLPGQDNSLSSCTAELSRIRSRRRLTAPLARPPPGSALGAPARHGRAAALAADQPGSSLLTPRAASTNGPVARGARAPDPRVWLRSPPRFHPYRPTRTRQETHAPRLDGDLQSRTAPVDKGPSIRPKRWQLSGSGEKCAPPSPGPELWVSPGTCQERLRRRCAMGYAHS